MMYRSSVIVAVLLFAAVFAEETRIEEINDDIHEADQPGNIPLFDVPLVQKMPYKEVFQYYVILYSMRVKIFGE